MKKWVLYSIAAAIVAAAVGWYFEGFLQAKEQFAVAEYRRSYIGGDHTATAIVWAAIALVVVLLIGLSRGKNRSKTTDAI